MTPWLDKMFRFALSRLLEYAFLKNKMISSLFPLCRRTSTVSRISLEKVVFLKMSSFFMFLLHCKIMWGYVFPQYLQETWLKLVNTLDLEQKRIQWQNKSVEWDVLQKLKCCQFKNLWSLHQDLNSPWSSCWLWS